MGIYAWLIIAALLTAVELATGTFYLLMLALAAVVSWIVSQSGASILVQIIVFLVVSGLLVVYLQKIRSRQKQTEQPNIAQNLDQNEQVFVTHWEHGIGQTRYRGANWQVKLLDEQTLGVDGTYQIVRLDSTHLIVQPTIKQPTGY